MAIELRHRAWVSKDRIDATLGWFSERGVAFVCVDAPPGEHVPIMPPIDAATRDDLAYFRIHGRNTDGYMTGKTVAERFGWRYEDHELEEIGERTRSARRERRRGARPLQQQPRRRRAHGRPEVPGAAGPGAHRGGAADP